MTSSAEDGFTNRLVFLHGFTQTHHHWHEAALGLQRRLGTSPALALVDLPGHGLSSDDGTPITEAAAELAALAGAGTYVGYSMGGRFALLAALERPDIVERLVLIGATAGIENDRERSERRSLDEQRADRVEDVGVEQFVDEWLAAPMFAGLRDDPSGLDHRRRNTARGLSTSLRSAGTGHQPSLWSRLGELETPSLVLAGEHDSKFVHIGNRLAAGMPQATFASISDAGHAAHVESPAATTEHIAVWLSKQ